MPASPAGHRVKNGAQSKGRTGETPLWSSMVDTDKIEASFKKGALTVTLPKKPEAQTPEKKIQVKAA